MDVNKPQGVHAVGDQPHRQPSDRQRETPDDDADEKLRRERYRSWSSDAAVDLGGVLSGPLSAESQKIVNALVAEMELLRADLEIRKKREEHFRDQAAQHAFLPLPNRREFQRELNHVIDHMYSLHPSPAILIVHVVTAATFRRDHGRRAADALLGHVAEQLSVAVHPTDSVCSVGGDDFGATLEAALLVKASKGTLRQTLVVKILMAALQVLSRTRVDSDSMKVSRVRVVLDSMMASEERMISNQMTDKVE